ncbi:hypothetical protein A8U91_00986 [Halomonas elongata]|uniref:Uncharacterized protein n=1 Tax=Halomonas elongata TaxID=2746 RepID=A0A1B8P372_HALEL|nr:hypothetical protein [Halomonas elongata]OBX36643.1 hypothetical protein A8U91_00986 [Halomonas elongata]
MPSTQIDAPDDLPSQRSLLHDVTDMPPHHRLRAIIYDDDFKSAGNCLQQPGQAQYFPLLDLLGPKGNNDRCGCALLMFH